MFPDLLLRGLPSLISSGVNLWNRGDNRELQLKQLEQNAALQELRLKFNAVQEREKSLHQSIEAERTRIAQQEHILMQQDFSKEQSAIQHAHTLTIEQLRQQFQKQESQFSREASRENLLFQLEQQRLNQLEIKRLDAEIALQLKQYDRETALKTIQKNRQNAINPLVNHVEDLLIGTGLHVFFAPPTVRGDKVGEDPTLKISETDLAGTLGKFLDRFTTQERPVIFHGGQWQTRAVHSETAARNIHRDLKSEPTIILETFSEKNMYHICVAFWAENWSDIRYKRLFEFDRDEVLKGFAKINTLKRQEEDYSKEEFEDFFGKAAYENYKKNLELIVKEDRARTRNMAEKDIKRNISSKYIATPDDAESVIQYIKLHHAFAVGALIDEYYWLHAPPTARCAPLLPQLLPPLLEDYALPPEQKANLLTQLADFYTQLYELSWEKDAQKLPESFLELADLYLQLQAHDKARSALEQSARAFLQNRCIPQLPNADTAGLAFLTQDLALPYLSEADGAFLAGLAQRMRQITDLADYSVIQGNKILLFQQEKQRRQPFEPEMILVEGGTFQMERQVTLSSFSIGKYPITQAQWKAVMGNSPSHFKGDDLPVEQVSWDDTQQFLSKLSSMTGKTYRLPTEAEWEFAARGGNKSKGFEYSGSNNLDEVGWFWENSGDKRLSGDWDWDKISKNNCKTYPVGKKATNELGIHDMSGNLWEWCGDWYGSYSSSAVTNPTGAVEGTRRVLRGGSWLDDSLSCRVAYRHCLSPSNRNQDYGFRVVSFP